MSFWNVAGVSSRRRCQRVIVGGFKERVGRRGRAKGGIIMGVREGLEGKGEVWGEEGMMVREIRWEEERWKVDTVYIGEDVGKSLRKIAEEREGREGETGWVIGRDFNARTGERGAIEKGEKGVERRSKDKRVNRQGEELLRWLGEEGWGIMNGAKGGDREGEFTFTGGRGESVIDYVIRDGIGWERVNRLEVGER